MINRHSESKLKVGPMIGIMRDNFDKVFQEKHCKQCGERIYGARYDKMDDGYICNKCKDDDEKSEQ